MILAVEWDVEHQLRPVTLCGKVGKVVLVSLDYFTGLAYCPSYFILLIVVLNI